MQIIASVKYNFGAIKNKILIVDDEPFNVYSLQIIL